MKHNKLISAFAAVAITSGVFTLVSSPVFAKDRPVLVVADSDIITRRISYADLNLASVSGQKTLNRRVGGAIHGLCSDATGGEDGNYVTNFSRMKCNKTAWSQARPQIAQATQRARDIAFTGASPIAAAAITIDLTK
jgi:UrcA family protein